MINGHKFFSLFLNCLTIFMHTLIRDQYFSYVFQQENANVLYLTNFSEAKLFYHTYFSLKNSTVKLTKQFLKDKNYLNTWVSKSPFSLQLIYRALLSRVKEVSKNTCSFLFFFPAVRDVDFFWEKTLAVNHIHESNVYTFYK